MRSATLILIIPFLFGCATSEVVQVNNQREKPTITLKYLNAGVSGIRSARREDAIEKAKRYCGGRVKLLDESSQAQFAGFHQMPNSNMALAVNQNYNYMLFECIDKEKQEIVY
jgi:hypothetical protein